MYIVNTRFVRKNGRVIVHAYGPFSKNRALSERKILLRETPLKEGEELSVHVLKVIDIDSLNYEVEPQR